MADTDSTALPPAQLRRKTAEAIARSRDLRARRIDDALSPENLARVGAAVRTYLNRIAAP